VHSGWNVEVETSFLIPRTSDALVGERREIGLHLRERLGIRETINVSYGPAEKRNETGFPNRTP
jgi:hypothetical protein